MTRPALTGRTTRVSVGLLAALAYLPALLTKPGRMPADTKLFLYLDPGRLITDAPFTWDTRQFGGWVPHQTIAYLWPQGPWYWLFEAIGFPDWVAHRLWIGTLLFLAALGVYWASRLLGLPRGAATVTAVVYMLSPYLLPYVSRTSAMLLPWAAVGWLVALTIRAATSDGRAARWRYAALIALVLLSCSAVNATAVLMIAPAPVLWLAHAVAQRIITWRVAMTTSLRIGGLASVVSLWWIMMLRAQGAYGADVLAFSESLEATSLTSASTETLRGMGYWLFYVRDPYAFTTTASQTYMESGRAIAVSFLLLALCVAGLAFTRWSQRRYAVLLVLVGIVLAVGVHPILDPSPLMSPLADNSRSSLALAFRSSTRALPLATFGFALGAGALVAAVGVRRWRLRPLAPVLVVVLAIVNLPALFDGNLVDPALERDQDPPTAWLDAADVLSASSSEYRVLQLPGSEFGAFRWGYTVDPPLPGLTTKPLVTRDLLPLGSAGVMDLLYALDDRVQSHTLDPDGVAAIARFLGVDTIWLANDLAFDRFRTPRPEELSELFATPPAGLGEPTAFGERVVNTPDIPMLDETELSSDAVGSAISPVELIEVLDPAPIVRASERVVVLVGSGDGIVDAAAAGLLDGTEAVIYAADFTGGANSALPAMVIVTDSNRDRAHHWRSSQDVVGFTETGGPGSDVLRLDDGDQRLPVFGPIDDADQQTIAYLDSGLMVLASGYGEPFAYRPEQRPAMAVDGNTDTAWVVADRADPVGHFLTVSATDGSLTLLQPQGTNANRMITSVVVTTADSNTETVAILDASSLVSPGQRIDLPDSSAATITITGVDERAGGTDTGPSAVGFAELGLGVNHEVVRVPVVVPATSAGEPLAIVLTRLRVDPRDRWRSDPERELSREFAVPSDGDFDFDVAVTLRRNDRAPDPVLDALDGVSGTTSNRRLVGVPEARGRFATDGDVTTAWTSPFADAVGSQLTIPLDGTPLTQFELRQPSDGRHSTITRVRVEAGGAAFDLDVAQPSTDASSTVVLPVAVTAPSLVLTVTAIEALTTIDRRFGEVTTLPVSITELTAPALLPATSSPAILDDCTSGLISIDGADVALRISAEDRTALAAGSQATVEPCDPLVLGSGPHRLRSAAGIETGLDIDQVVLAHGVAPAGTPAPQVDVQRTRTTRTATVAPCPSGCWLIFGEGFNTGWSATTGDGSLGAPLQISGGFNGWWLPPSDVPRTAHIEWQAQTPVTVGLGLSALAVVGCVLLALRRVRWVGETRWIADPPAFARHPLRPLPFSRALLGAVVLVLFTAVLVSPSMGLAAAVPAALLLATRRSIVTGAAALLLVMVIGARVVKRQLSGRFAANAGWPGNFHDLHGPGMLVVTLLLVTVVMDTDNDEPPTEHDRESVS